MLKYMLYKNGKCIDGSGLNYEIPTDKNFIWIFMEKPSDAEIEKVANDFKINKKYFQTYVKEQRSVRYSINPLIFVFIDYYMENDEIKSSHLLFVLKKNCLIISLPIPAKYHSDLFDKIVEVLKHGKTKNIARIMYEFLADDINENYDVLERVDRIVAEMERKTFNANSKHMINIEEIVNFKRKIFRMSRRFWASAKIIFLLRKGLTPIKLDKESILLMEDIYNSYMHQIDILSSERETLSDILSIYTANTSNRLATISNELNQVMKKLTALTVIIMVPALIAGIYGMNFANMPELHWEYGYYVVLISMIIIILLLYKFFHKREWI
ncbi:MAG: magnesium transporter CorA family protein [Candidatus Aenigmatarchaeota archaeon]